MKKKNHKKHTDTLSKSIICSTYREKAIHEIENRNKKIRRAFSISAFRFAISPQLVNQSIHRETKIKIYIKRQHQQKID